MNLTKILYLPLFLFLLLIVLFYGIQNYHARLGNDEYNHVMFARDLAEGHFFQDYPMITIFSEFFPEDKTVYVRYGGYRLRQGKLFSKIEIGYPLILSLATRLIGENALFLLTPLMLILFMIFFFLMVREVFFNDFYRNYIALISVLVIILLPCSLIQYGMNPLRDIPSMTFLIAGLYLLFRSVRNKSLTISYFFLSIFFLGISCTIRLTNVLIGLPVALYLIVFVKKLISFRKFLLLLLFSGIIFCIALIPSFVQNYLTSGNIFVPTQSAEAKGLLPFLPGERKGTGLDLSNLLFSLPGNIKWLFSVYHPVIFVLVIIGIYLSIKKPEILLVFLPAPIIFFLFFNMFGRSQEAKYFIFIHPFLISFLAYAIVRIFSFTRKKIKTSYPKRFPGEKRILITTLILFCLSSYYLLHQSFAAQNFGLKEAKLFKKGIESVVPAGAMVLGTRYLTPNIDFHTHAYSMNPYQLCEPWGLSIKESLNILLEKGIPLYVFDNRGVEEAWKFIPEILDHFDIVPVAKLNAVDLHIYTRNVSARKDLTLYKIEKWKNKEIVIQLKTPQQDYYLLTLDAHKIWETDKPRKELTIYLNNNKLNYSIKNGINTLILPSELITIPSTEFIMKSDIPLPQDMFVNLEPVGKEFLINVGKEDNHLILDGFYQEEIYEGTTPFRWTKKEASIEIPTLIKENSKLQLIMKILKSRPASISPADVTIFINGKKIGSFSTAGDEKAKIVEFDIPSDYISNNISVLTISTSTWQPSSLMGSADNRTLGIMVDWIKIINLQFPKNTK